MIELLTLSGASLEIEDEDGDTPFHSASSLAVMDHLAEGQYHLITSHSTVVVGITLGLGLGPGLCALTRHPRGGGTPTTTRTRVPATACALTLRSLH